jgi:hypothetical protein
MMTTLLWLACTALIKLQVGLDLRMMVSGRLYCDWPLLGAEIGCRVRAGGIASTILKVWSADPPAAPFSFSDSQSPLHICKP